MSLAYDRTGTGEPLVLLHGLGHRRQAFDAVVPLLVSDREVITVDLPAMGESPLPAVGDYRTMADMLEKLFGDLGIERPHVAGNSLGDKLPDRAADMIIGNRLARVGLFGLLLFPHQARRAQQAYPAARFVPMPGVGHLPMGDDPEPVAALLLESSRGQ